MRAEHGKGSPPWSAAAEIAATQWGNVTTAQLRRCRCSSEMIAVAVEAGRLHRAYQGVFGLGRPPTTPHERAMAAVLAGGQGALLSYLWALWLYTLGRLPTGVPDVSVPRSRRSRPGVHRRRTMPEADENFGIPVTTPAQTLADCAPLLTEDALRAAANRALTNHLTNRDKLMVFPALRSLVSEHGATRSVLEDLLFDLSRELEIDPPKRNNIVHGVEVDFYFPHLRHVIEANGYAFHHTRIQFETDHERRLHLEARGERVTSVTHRQVTRLRAQTQAQLTAIFSA